MTILIPFWWNIDILVKEKYCLHLFDIYSYAQYHWKLKITLSSETHVQPTHRVSDFGTGIEAQRQNNKRDNAQLKSHGLLLLNS